MKASMSGRASSFAATGLHRAMPMSRRKQWVIAAALLGSGCVDPVRSVSVALGAEGDQNVYVAVLDSLFSSSTASHLIVVESTLEPRWVQSVRPSADQPPNADGVERSTAANFRSANARSKRIAGIPGTRIPVEIVPDSVFANLPRGMTPQPPEAQNREPFDYWRAFRTQFPNTTGIIRLSSVGYSSDGEQALVEVSHGCGSLCGEGSIVLLEKRDGVWMVRSIRTTWRV